MKLEDITLDFVRDCYAKTGLTPTLWPYTIPGKTACALQVIGVVLGVRAPKPEHKWQYVLEQDEMRNFYRGFDCGFTDCDTARLGNAIAIGLGLRAAPVMPELRIDWTALVRRAHEQVAAERRGVANELV